VASLAATIDKAGKTSPTNRLIKGHCPCQGGAERGQEALTGKFHFVNRNPG